MSEAPASRSLPPFATTRRSRRVLQQTPPLLSPLLGGPQHLVSPAVQGSGFRVQGSGFRVQGWEFMVHASLHSSGVSG